MIPDGGRAVHHLKLLPHIRLFDGNRVGYGDILEAGTQACHDGFQHRGFAHTVVADEQIDAGVEIQGHILDAAKVFDGDLFQIHKLSSLPDPGESPEGYAG